MKIKLDDTRAKKYNLTSKKSDIFNQPAPLIKLVKQLATPDMKILDYGAGKYCRHVIELRNLGLDVTAYDIANNVTELHDVNALDRQYDLVYANCVLNILDLETDIDLCINEIWEATKQNGMAIINVPYDCRGHIYKELGTKGSTNLVYGKLYLRFSKIKNVGSRPSRPLYILENKI